MRLYRRIVYEIIELCLTDLCFGDAEASRWCDEHDEVRGTRNQAKAGLHTQHALDPA